MTPPRKQIRLNAFDMNTVGHMLQGLWKHPRDRAVDYAQPGYWIELAQLFERGLFDGVFIADLVGVYDVLGGGIAATAREAVQFPVNDPTPIVPLMAQATTHLGFAVTVNLTYEHPYMFARRMATLDHLTGGRVAWNVVTGFLDSAARGIGRAHQEDHDDRYDRGDDFMEAFYKLLEGGWEDGAVLADRARGMYADPARIHRVWHEGPYYKVGGVYPLSAPSPQRTPVLYQAGASQRGYAFAARHAECAFTSSPQMARSVATLRALAVQAGRQPDDIQVYSGLNVVVDRSAAAAREKYEDYQRYASAEGTLAHMASGMGIDFERFGPDEEITEDKIEALVPNRIQRVGEGRVRRFPEGTTRRKLLSTLGFGKQPGVIVGTPSQVADEMARLVTETDVDGFCLLRTVTPECYRDFIDLVVPELQERGLYKTAYAEGTLRQKLFGPGSPHLPASHYGAQFRVPR